jgi:hypothetical protein
MKLLTKVVIATSTFACAAPLSCGWSEQRGVSLSVESAQARVGRPLTPVSVTGVARRQYRRGAYGYGAGVVGAATSPWGWGGDPNYTGTVTTAQVTMAAALTTGEAQERPIMWWCSLRHRMGRRALLHGRSERSSGRLCRPRHHNRGSGLVLVDRVSSEWPLVWLQRMG